MKSILRLSICAVLLMAGLCGCEKINLDRLEGTWSEQYDPTVFAMDGSLNITLDGNGKYQVQTYDALSGKSDAFSGVYILNDECFKEKNTITFNPYMSDFTNVTYIIVKLTSDEMAWQKIGDAPNPGSWASEYRHFVRVK
jgi:hypothetical protein